MNSEQPVYSAQLQSYISRAERLQNEIAESRQSLLAQLATLVRKEKAAGLDQHLVFICTHNSRRSHFAHVWFKIALSHYCVANVCAWSGGTEVTQCNPRTVAAMIRSGLQVRTGAGQENPIYEIQYTNNGTPIECCSKIYNQSPNPAAGYFGILCCSDVDERCPVIEGAHQRISLHYLDPKISDDTPQEQTVYDERCLQIASEMFFLASQI